MKRSILWNGFEIKRGEIPTSVGNIPYLCYTPEISTEVVNIALHGESHDKEEWLCFNSILQQGNLLKESIRNNSAFIAFDLYGHGEWTIEEKDFNIGDLSKADQKVLIYKTSKALEEAIPLILKQENLSSNQIAITAYSIGCSVMLECKLEYDNMKAILISPHDTDIKSLCRNYLVIQNNDSPRIKNLNLRELFSKLPKGSVIRNYDSEDESPVNWINHAKEFIYF